MTKKLTTKNNNNTDNNRIMTFEENLMNYARASYPILVINSFEEKRVVYDIYEILKKREGFGKFYFWDSVKGLLCHNDNAFNPPKDSQDPQKLLNYIQDASIRKETKSVFVLKDFHFEMESKLHAKIYIRKIRQLVNFFRKDGNMLVFVSPEFPIPKELEKEVQIVDYPVPNEDEIRLAFKESVATVNSILKEREQPEIKVPSHIETNCVDAAKGMTMDEIDSTFSLASVISKGKYDETFVDVIFKEKIAQVRKGNLLTYIPSNIDFNQVGGLNGIKRWIELRKKAYTQEARKYGIVSPKGILLAGVSGSGK